MTDPDSGLHNIYRLLLLIKIVECKYTYLKNTVIKNHSCSISCSKQKYPLTDLDPVGNR